jgi:iron(III) transport system ATP-binding protein
MGEALLFSAESLADGRVRLGELCFTPLRALPAGPVKVAVRPEAWHIGAPGSEGLAATVQKCAYLGSFLEVTLATALGEIFVVAPDMRHAWVAGERVTLQLAGRGISVVAA